MAENSQTPSGPLTGLRVAYVPYSSDCLGAGDRRRFCYYAKKRGIEYEVYQRGKSYDLVVLSSLADLPWWSRRPETSGPRIVYELIDSYLDIPRSELKARLRGSAKYLLRQHSHLEVSYHDSIARMARRADAVVCSTPEQKSQLSAYSNNVHDILDVHDGDARTQKNTYECSETINFVWEGQAPNLDAFAHIARVLRRVDQTTPIALHILTDLTYKPVNGPVPRLSTQRILEKYLPGVRCYLYEWNPLMFAKIATACDIALIPMLRNSPPHMAKPENKLLLFWRMGIPALVESTPAYERAMSGAGQQLTCSNDTQWSDKLSMLVASEDARRAAGTSGRDYANTVQGAEILLEKWDALFESVKPGSS